jgi:hypothetical protein
MRSEVKAYDYSVKRYSQACWRSINAARQTRRTTFGEKEKRNGEVTEKYML